MDIVVTQIKQIGREIMLDGNSLIGYQHSANLFIKLIEDALESNPFAGMVLSAYCSSWKSDMPIVCPLQEKDDGTYILLPEGIFDHEGDVYLSLAAINENKIVITSNQLTLQVDGSNRIVSKVSPSEKYWEIEVLNAMKVWYANVVDPTFNSSNEKLNQLIRRTEEHEEKAEDLQKKAEEQQTAVDQSTAAAVQATQTANTAATNANEKAAAANDAAQAANKAKSDADTAVGKANKAASDANAAANNANTKAGEAATAASEANTARDSANTLTQTVQQKLTNGDFDGRTTYNGIGDPAVSLGKNGDTYLNKSNEGQHPKWLYLKENGKWTPLWNTKGDKGDPGQVNVADNYTTTDPTYALSAPKGKELHDNLLQIGNSNLLINGDFQIWQRGTVFKNIRNSDYCADRWRVYRRSDVDIVNVEKVDDGLKITCDTGEITGEFNVYQSVDKNEYAWLIGKKTIVTQSINDIVKKYERIQRVEDNSSYINIVSVNGLKANDVINYVKVELGEIATPLVPRPYAEELMLCQRYYQDYSYNAIKSIPFINDSTYLHFSFKLVPEMRVPPTLLNDSKFYADGLYRMTDGGYDRISEIRISKLSKSNEFSFTVIGASKLVVGMQYVINNNSVIKGLDAEIY